MADFLSRLAARALGATPVAEPVLPARFSPAAEHVSVSSFQSAVQTFPAAPLDLIRSARHAQPPTARSADTHTLCPNPAFPDVDHTPHPTQPSLARSYPLHHFAAPAMPLFIQPHAHIDSQDMRPGATPAPILPHHAAENTYEDDTSPDSQSKASTLPAQNAFAEPMPARHLPFLSPPVRAGEQSGPSTRSPLKPAVPTVRVTIGSIEVRAEIAAPAPARSAARTRPAHVSLEQFLRQSGGDTR